MEIIEKIAILFLAPATVIGAITYLSKQFIEGFFKSKQKEYELTLKNRLDTELHTYKEELENENLRFRVKVAGVYERQAEILIELYKRIEDVDCELFNVINYASGNSPIYEKFNNAFRELRTYYRKNKILLPETTDVLIEALINDAFWSAEGHKSAENRLTNTGVFTEGEIEKIFDKKREASELSKTVPQIKSELTNKLREIIGVPVL